MHLPHHRRIFVSISCHHATTSVSPHGAVKSTPSLENSISYLLTHVERELAKTVTTTSDRPEVHRHSAVGEDLHLSLSRTFYLLEPQINPFVKALRAALSGFAR